MNFYSFLKRRARSDLFQISNVKYLIFLSILTVGLMLPTVASAHVLKTDSSVGAVLHINPEDDPIIGQNASFFFEFKDTQNKFKPEDCECTFSIIQGNKEIHSQPLFQNNSKPSLTNAAAFYTFPEKGVYQIKVIGRPTKTNAFEPFTLTYDIRVARETDSPINQPLSGFVPFNQPWISKYIVPLTALAIVLIFTIIALARQKINKDPEPKGIQDEKIS